MNGRSDETAQSAAHTSKVDVVRDCCDLAGEFPPNVGLVFGELEPTPGSARGLLPARYFVAAGRKVGRDLAGAKPDVIAVVFPLSEDPRQPDMSPERFVADVFDGANEIVAGWQSGERDIKKDPNPPLGLVQRLLLSMVLGLHRAGAGVFPRLEPLLYEPPSGSGSAIFDSSMPYADRAMREAQQARASDEVLIRQLHALATRIAADGQQHILAVVDDNMGSLVSVAAKLLGAPVSYATSTPEAGLPLWHRLIRQIRQAGGPLDAEQFGQFERAEQLALRLSYLAYAYLMGHDDGSRRARLREQRLNTAIGDYCLRGIWHTLSPDHQITFDKFNQGPAQVVVASDVSRHVDWDPRAVAIVRPIFDKLMAGEV